MSSVLPYVPVNSHVSKKQWGWRDTVLIILAMGLVYTVGKPFAMAETAYSGGEFFSAFLWSLGGTATLALSVVSFIVAMTHEATTGVRKFFRDRPNVAGFIYLGVGITSAGLCFQMSYLALLLKEPQSFIAVSYAGSAIFFGLLAFGCGFGVLGWAFRLVSKSSDSYIEAAKQGDPHDY